VKELSVLVCVGAENLHVEFLIGLDVVIVEVRT
jgi:hypothetical protein